MQSVFSIHSNSISKIRRIFNNTFFSRHSSYKEEEVSIFQISDPRVGAGILLQRLHQQGEKVAAVQNAKPDRPPGQNLVPE